MLKLSSMSSTYRTPGLSFSYPPDWQVAEQHDDDRLTVTVAGAGTAFGTVTILYDRPETRDVVTAAVHAFREEYTELDVYDVRSQIASQPALGCDIDFICLELCNTALLRAFRTPQFTVLMLFQSSDIDLEQAKPVFDQMCNSLTCGTDSLWDEPA